jgi:uncharacterized protein (TIGR00297 family)
VLTGFLASALVAGLAWLRRSLSPSGAAAAIAVGTAVWAGGGARWFAVLMTFFVTSTALGRVGRAAKETTKREFSKGDRRDALQVLANGGVAAAAAALFAWRSWPGFAALFVGALATANGDTWATELGVLSRREPISLTTFRRVPRGTSGAVSPLGLVATLSGAAAVALPLASLRWIGVAAVAGFLGSLADSLLGATLQTRFHCPSCDKLTEGERHHCGALTTRVGGYVGNDAVNLFATCAGAAVALMLT